MRLPRRLINCLLVCLLSLVCLDWAWAQGPMDESPQEREAGLAVAQQKLVRLRELARQMVEEHPERPGSYYYYGYSLHHSEGDLPRARFYLEKALHTFESKYTLKPRRDEPWGVLNKILLELEQVLSEMDQYQEQIRILDIWRDLLEYELNRKLPGLQTLYAWPLMKLGREKEARQRLNLASTSLDEATRTTYLNSKGALEQETDNPRACYDAFQELVATVRTRGWRMSCCYLRNAGEAAATMGRFDEAERFYLDSTEYFEATSYSNPWLDLGTLYLSEARFPEAISALKKAHEWANATQPFLAQQSWAATQQLTCEVFLQLGMTEDAMRVAEAFLDRPDRKGGDSVQRDQAEAANLIIYREALRSRKSGAREEMSWAKGRRWWTLLWEQRKMAWNAYYTGQRAAATMVEHGRLHTSLRWCYIHGTVVVPNYIRPELVTIYGPGVVIAAIEEQQAKQWEGKQVEQPYLLSLLAEAQALLGNTGPALQNLAQAIEKLPRAEVLLKFRLLARQASLLERSGGTGAAIKAYQQIMEQAPSTMRTLELALPVKVEGDSAGMLSQASSMMLNSPRFREDSGGLTVRMAGNSEQLRASLLGLDGTVISTANVKVLSDSDQTARDLVAEIHAKFFSPHIDMSQLDIKSLDGMTTGQVQSQKLQDMFFPGHH